MMRIDDLPFPENVKTIIKKDIPDFNPVQKKGIPAVLKEKNVVVASPTASGKTLIAEIAVLSHYLNGGKTVYLVPLKALASEKYHEFKKKYPFMRTVVSTGDMDSTSQWLGSYDLIIVSNEKMDSLLRHGVSWLKDVSLLVVDEIHLLNDAGRGPTLEVVMTQLVPSVKQTLALSATISNAEEIAQWLDARLIKSDYRPVKLEKGIAFPEQEKTIVDFMKKEVSFNDTLVEDTIKKKKQALLFLSTRRSAESSAEKTKLLHLLSQDEKKKLEKLSHDIENVLPSPTKQCRRLAKCVKHGTAFHHAGLVAKQRKLIEDAFRDGKLKVITATTSLAYGLNMPAYRVLIRDTKRFDGRFGAAYIPVMDVQQMMGRCIGEDTVLFDDKNQPIKLGDLASKYFKNDGTGKKEIKNNIRILSLDIKTKKQQSPKIIYLWKRKAGKLLQIETRSGKKLVVTPDHRILTFTKTKSGKPRISNADDKNIDYYEKTFELRKKYKWGPHRIAKFLGVPEKCRMIQHWLYDGSKPKKKAFVWKKANELKVGKGYRNTDHVAILGNFNDITNIKHPDEFLPHDKIIHIGKSVYMNKQGHQKCKFPVNWTKELVRFIAKIMSDGSIYHNKKENSYQIKYFNKNLHIQKEYCKIIKNLFFKEVALQFRRGTYESRFKSFIVGKFLENIGIPSGRKARILRMPDIIFSLPRKLIREFILEYVRCDGYESQDKYNIVTSSENLAYDFCLLFQRIGLVSRINRKNPNTFRKTYGYDISITKSQFYKTRRKNSIGNVYPDMIKSINVLNGNRYVYDITLNSCHNFLAGGIVVHNSGRPRYDSEGQAIIIAKSKDEAADLKERYLLSESEPIESKLGMEAQLRMHVLALIASEVVKTKEELRSFFSRTFFASQFGTVEEVMDKVEKILSMLEKFRFIRGELLYDEFKPAFDMASSRLEATKIGKRVSQLYIDPLSAKHLIENISAQELEALMVLNECREMEPLLRVRKKDVEEIEDALVKSGMVAPDVWDYEYEDFLDRFKTTLMLQDWIDEKNEDYLMETYGIRPGELHNKLLSAEWMLYAASELALLLNKRNETNNFNKLRLRVKHGVREELLRLIKIKGIGRVRARRLYKSGIKTYADIKKAKPQLEKLLGKKVAASVLKQLDEDREEKMKRIKSRR